MCLRNHLMELFADLPFLSKASIIKHLDHFDLLRLVIISENWENVVQSQLKTRKSLTLKIQLSATNDGITLMVWNADDVHEKLSIRFELRTNLSENLPRDNQTQMCYSEDFDILKRKVADVFRTIRKLFVTKVTKIHINFDIGVDLDFLRSLECEYASNLTLEGENPVDAVELDEILQTLKVPGNTVIKVKMIGYLRDGPNLLGSVQLEDSRCITRKKFHEKFDCTAGVFKHCKLISQDYNMLLKKWQNGFPVSSGGMEFHSRRKLSLKQILDGLDAKTWDPKARDRKQLFYESDNPYYRFVNLAEGYDISNSEGKLGTIHLSENGKVLKFYYWRINFPLREAIEDYTEIVTASERMLKSGNLVGEERLKREEILNRATGKLRMLNDELNSD